MRTDFSSFLLSPVQIIFIPDISSLIEFNIAGGIRVFSHEYNSGNFFLKMAFMGVMMSGTRSSPRESG